MASVRKRARGPAPGRAEGSLRLATAVRLQQRRLRTVVARLETCSVEDVHRGRVAARRLRSILKTFGPLFDAGWARRYREDLRGFARALGRVREADVLGEALGDAVASTGLLTPVEVARLATALELARHEAREDLREHASGPKWRALTSSLAARAARAPRLERIDAGMLLVLRLADRAWRKAKRLLRRHPESARDLHELRLALKHCRYALEVVADIEPKAAARLLRRLRRAQEALGAHRDGIAAAQWVLDRKRTLGLATARRLDALLATREAQQRRDAAARAIDVLTCYVAWRDAVRPLMRRAEPGRA